MCSSPSCIPARGAKRSTWPTCCCAWRCGPAHSRSTSGRCGAFRSARSTRRSPQPAGSLPSQLRRMMRDQGRDLHGEFVRLLPTPPRPIGVQRWSARRVGLLLLVLVALFPAVPMAWAFASSARTRTPGRPSAAGTGPAPSSRSCGCKRKPSPRPPASPASRRSPQASRAHCASATASRSSNSTAQASTSSSILLTGYT